MGSTSDTETRDDGRRVAPSGTGRTGVGGMVFLSLAAGLVAALLLPFVPLVPSAAVDQNFATGMVLLGFALGWALLALLTTRLTDQPQGWAAVPAVFMLVAAVLVLFLPDSWVDALGWVWPPALVVLVVWVFLQARRDLRSRSRGWLLHPVLAVLVVVAVAGAYETVGRAAEDSVAMHGHLVDVGPYRLHLECSGSGTPTVIIEPGGGASAATLGWVAPAVARDTRVCVYDRAGRGWSDAAATPPDGTQVTADLHTLLERAHVPGPYVLAGHSFGGLYVQTYAARYPDQVAGLVLVDSTAPRSAPPPAPQSDSYSFVKHLSALLSTTARLGVPRLVAQTSFSELPPRYEAEARANAATAQELAGFVDEYAVAGRSTEEAGQLTGLDGKPLVVLTADHGSAPGWTADQDEMATLSSNSQHYVVPGSTHQSLTADPEDAAVVSRAILDVVEAVRTGEPVRGR